MDQPTPSAALGVAPGAPAAASISVVLAAYQAERWLAEALDSVLVQSRPADEVVVVDDGSTDGTAAIVARYADRVRTIRQENRGAAAAFNRGFAASRGDFIALCACDDVWEPRKLEWQAEAIAAHPEADVLFGHALIFGLVSADHPRPPSGMSGLLDPGPTRDGLFAENFVCAPTAVIRRDLLRRLGPFREDTGTEDYEFWLRCLRAGARFFYDPRVLVHWRQHADNHSAAEAMIDRCTYEVRREHQAEIGDRAALDRGLAQLIFRIARRAVEDDPKAARRMFLESLRHARGQSLVENVRAAIWVIVLSLPAAARRSSGRAIVGLSRRVDSLLGRRQPLRP